jgi:ribosomal protein L21E
MQEYASGEKVALRVDDAVKHELPVLVVERRAAVHHLESER